MNLRSMNNNLFNLELLYADNIISLRTFTSGKNKILKLIEGDEDLSYDEEMNIIYRISKIQTILNRGWRQ